MNNINTKDMENDKYNNPEYCNMVKTVRIIGDVQGLRTDRNYYCEVTQNNHTTYGFIPSDTLAKGIINGSILCVNGIYDSYYCGILVLTNIKHIYLHEDRDSGEIYASLYKKCGKDKPKINLEDLFDTFFDTDIRVV